MTDPASGGFTFILGGARSGKSRLAEHLTLQHAAARAARPVYIATAEAHDGEMAVRIATHQARRGASWHTVEAPLALAAAIDAADAPGNVILVDCLTLWLSNQMLRAGDAGVSKDAAGGEDDLTPETTALLAALQRCAVPITVVSNEVGLGIVPDNRLARRFRDAAGGLHQAVAAAADAVLFIAAGLPLALKGTLPELDPAHAPG